MAPRGSKLTPRILVLSRYGRLGASSRLRMIQYLPGLMLEGFDIEVSPMFADAYVQKLYRGAPPLLEVLRSYAHRIGRLFAEREFDIIWLEKEIWPWVPWLLESAFLPRSVRFVVDFDDAVFHRYDLHRSPVLRELLGRKLDKLMARVDCVVAGNKYLEDRARTAGARRVEVIPTVIDLDRYPSAAPRQASGPVRIGWIGSPNTAKYLPIVSSVLGRLAREESIDCVAVGAREDQVVDTPFRAVPWKEEFEVDQLRSFDIGIMPLENTPWEKGKCGYKLIQYMACGMPVVASPVGVNEKLVVQGRNGFLAASEEHWYAALRELVENAGLRERMARDGRERVERVYNADVQLPRLVEIFRSLDVAG